MSIQFAPTELLLQIFQCLPKSCLLQCATVCRTWQAPAIQLFYESVELSEKTKAVWLHIVRGTPTTENNVGVFVRKLTVSLTFSTTMTQADFLKVLSYLPFIKSIDLNLSGYKLHYLAYLSKRGTGCVTYLEDINTGDLFTDYQMQQYFLCAYSFRHSLKNLTLRNPNAIYNIDGKLTTAISVLDKFENLNHISVISDSPADNNEISLLLESFQACPKLVHFTYKNNYMQMHRQPNYEEFNQLQKRDLLLRFRPSKLQTIELHLPILTEHYIKNILHSFPMHLNTLIITMTNTDYRPWIQSHNELFGLHLGYVKNLNLSISNFSRRGFNRNAGPKPKTTEELSQYWLFIHSIIGERPHIFFQLKFTAYKSGSRPDLSIERDDRNLILSFNSDGIQDLYACLEEFFFVYCSSGAHLPRSPCFNSHVKVESIVVELPIQGAEDLSSAIKCLDAVISSNNSSYLTSIPQSILIILANSSTSCSNQKRNKSYIHLGSPCLEDSHSKQLTAATACHLKFNIIIPLDYVIFENICFSNSFLLQTIVSSSLLCQVKLLKLIGCKYLDQQEQETMWNMYTIDLYAFKHLDQLVLDFSSFLNRSRQSTAPDYYQAFLLKVEMCYAITTQVLFYRLHNADPSSPCDLHSYCFLETPSPGADNKDYTTFVTIKCQHIDQIVGIHINEKTILGTISLR